MTVCERIKNFPLEDRAEWENKMQEILNKVDLIDIPEAVKVVLKSFFADVCLYQLSYSHTNSYMKGFSTALRASGVTSEDSNTQISDILVECVKFSYLFYLATGQL